MSLNALFFAQHVSNAASTFIFRSLRLCVSILLWFDVCWRYGVVRLGWCGIVMQAEAVLRLGWCGTIMQAEAGLSPGFVMHKGVPIAIVRLRHKKL